MSEFGTWWSTVTEECTEISKFQRVAFVKFSREWPFIKRTKTFVDVKVCKTSPAGTNLFERRYHPGRKNHHELPRENPS